tara:strand:+ start:4185 stop:5345 length:1161 start_codon:yes stop_codon:yes gene_type:complete
MSKNKKFISYGSQLITDDDIDHVVESLKSDWLTTGPYVDKFEKKFSKKIKTNFSVAIANGTAALHAAMYALNISDGDEVILPSLTFAATANSVIYMGGRPIFCDINPKNLLIDVDKIEELITSKTKAIITVDYAGHPSPYDELIDICKKYSIKLVSDSCHALGATYNNKPVGSQADISTFSFHPVKPITTGEGGMVCTSNKEYFNRLKIFRNHGIKTEFREREEQGIWHYEIDEPGYNYRLTDFQSALGISQLKKIDQFTKHRNNLAKLYIKRFKNLSNISLLSIEKNITHAYHLFVIKINFQKLKIDKKTFFSNVRKKGVGLNVHYIPVHLHPFYIKNHLSYKGLCPVSEKAYEEIITIPLHMKMDSDDVDYVVETLNQEIENLL